MSLDFGNVDAGLTLYIPFNTFDSNGASITITGLAITDIECYKNGSTTQRSSDAGYVLLDTDGIDFDGITGIHGFSIDLADNTDAGFYVAGAFYWVVISAITVDTRTVNFVAATFRIGPVAANTTQWLGTAAATPTVAGVPEVDLTHLVGVAQSATDLKDFADDGYDPATNKVQGVVLTDTVTTYTGNTPQTGDSFARIGVAGAGLTNIDLPNQTMDITGNITGNLSGSVGSVTGAVGSVTGAVGSVAADVGITQGAADKVWLSAARTLTSFGTLVADIWASATRTLTSFGTLTADAADKLLGRNLAGAADGGRTVKDALRVLRNKRSIVGGTLTVTIEDDVTAAWTATVATAVSDPVSSVDPA